MNLARTEDDPVELRRQIASLTKRVETLTETLEITREKLSTLRSAFERETGKPWWVGERETGS